MGAIYQLLFSTCLFFSLILTTISTRFYDLPFHSLHTFSRWTLSIANLIPFSLSLYILFLLKSNRLEVVELAQIESPLKGNFQNSLSSSFIQF